MPRDLARLIAAAPDLLAFAERVSRMDPSDPEEGPTSQILAAVEEARAAIAKATGQEV